MKRMILELTIGLGILFLISFLMIGLSVYCVRENYKLEFQSTLLVLGNSHPECAIDDRSNKEIKNFARSAEPLYYTYYKLEWLLRWNPGIETVCVELSENQLESRMAEWIWSEGSLQRQILSLFPFLPIEHHLRAIKRSPVQYMQCVFMASKKLLSGFLLFNNQQDFFKHLDWGGFREQKGVHLEVKSYGSSNQKQEELQCDPDNIKALDDMIELCERRGVELIFIRSPYHPDRLNNFEISFKRFVSNHSVLKFIDFKDFQLVDECFFDSEHLNADGAKIFTPYFLKAIKDID